MIVYRQLYQIQTLYGDDVVANDHCVDIVDHWLGMWWHICCCYIVGVVVDCYFDADDGGGDDGGDDVGGVDVVGDGVNNEIAVMSLWMMLLARLVNPMMDDF